MLRFESTKVTITGNLIVTDDLPQVDIDMKGDRPTYHLEHRGNVVAHNIPLHLALINARSFWQKVVFCWRLLTGKYPAKNDKREVLTTLGKV